MSRDASGIHPTARVDAGAVLADDVSVGAYSIIGPDVQIGAGTSVGPHVTIKGPTRIGAGNRIYQFNSIGDDLRAVWAGKNDDWSCLATNAKWSEPNRAVQ